MKRVIDCLALTLFLASPALAQDSKQTNAPTLPPGVASQLQSILGGVLTAPKSSAPAVPTTFTSSGKSLFLDEMLARMNLAPAQKEAFKRYVTQVTKLVETVYQEHGFDKNDLGVALGGLLETCCELNQGTFKIGAASPAESEESKRKTRLAVHRIQQALGSAPAFKTMSNQNKQIAYELCTFTLGHLVVTWQQAGLDTNKQNEVRRTARYQLQTLFKLDPDNIVFNAAGEFVLKKNPAFSAASGTDNSNSTAAGQNAAPTASPPSAPGRIHLGGAIQEGIYAGSQFYGDHLLNRYRLYLYKSGQYRLYDTNNKLLSNSAGQSFSYEPGTGKLDLDYGMQYMMFNGSDPTEDYCFYGHDSEGKPFVSARSDRGFSLAKILLRYMGPIDRPSPPEEAQAKAAAEAEAKRYKWVVSPGQGLKPSQIAGILLHQDVHQFFNGTGLSFSMTYHLYLLLNDGTVYKGLPVAPDELDVSRSRRNEPQKWGRWKREGSAYLAAWPNEPGLFKRIKGSPVKPGGQGQRLTGRFGAGATSGSLMGGSYRIWGVTFASDGRFIKDNSGGYSSSTLVQNSGMASINSTHDDSGSYTSASGDNFVVGTGKKNKASGNRSGSYSLNGYVLTLRYDNGVVERLPFFFKDSKQEEIWFEGATLGRDEEKK